jgi:pimeloyl-ACP methyl ester carboxylesterase
MDFSAHRQSIEIDGSTLSYLDIGQGPDLLLGHSYLWDSSMWAPQIAHLSRSFRCLVPELWGHGDSLALPEGCTNLEDIAAQMLQLLDELKIDKCHLLGLSVGAMWGAELVLQAPQRVQSLVMMDSFIGFEPEVTRAKYLAMLDKIETAQAIPADLIETITPLFFASDTAQLQPVLIEGFKETLAGIPTKNIDTLVSLGRMIFNRRDTLELAEQFTLPCLIMVGIEDKTRTVLESYLMQDCIDASCLVTLPGAGHIATLEQPELVNNALDDFYAKVAGLRSC